MITAGGCLGILIPPSVMLIVYGAVAGVSVVQLYAGAFFPGIMLAGLYVAYVMILAKLRPDLAPPLPMSERVVALPPDTAAISKSNGDKVIPALLAALKGPRDAVVTTRAIVRNLATTLMPAIVFVVLMGLTWHSLTKPNVIEDTSALEQMGRESSAPSTQAPDAGAAGTDLIEPPAASDQSSTGLAEPPAEEAKDGAAPTATAPKAAAAPTEVAEAPVAAGAPQTAAGADWKRIPAPTAYWIVLGIGAACLIAFYAIFTFARLEIFKMLLSSFFPLAVMILAVLGSIVFGLATPTEAAAVGSLGGFVLAAIYALLKQPEGERKKILSVWVPLWVLVFVSIVWFLLLKFEVLESAVPLWVGWLSIGAAAIWCVLAVFQVNLQQTVRESVFLTAKTSAMVCWLFVGSSIFSAAFALLGGQEVVEHWVLSLGLTPIQFMILAQIIIFLLGWPLEWTEIIVIFMPIFIPLLAKFNIDPLFFGLLVALNLQTAFLSPPVAMAAFYLKGVAPKHVTLNQIFAGMLPFMAIQVVALALLYIFPEIGMWLPHTLYK